MCILVAAKKILLNNCLFTQLWVGLDFFSWRLVGSVHNTIPYLRPCPDIRVIVNPRRLKFLKFITHTPIVAFSSTNNSGRYCTVLLLFLWTYACHHHPFLGLIALCASTAALKIYCTSSLQSLMLQLWLRLHLQNSTTTIFIWAPTNPSRFTIDTFTRTARQDAAKEGSEVSNTEIVQLIIPFS